MSLAAWECFDISDISVLYAKQTGSSVVLSYNIGFRVGGGFPAKLGGFVPFFFC
jgi:hypothetical protein